MSRIIGANTLSDTVTNELANVLASNLSIPIGCIIFYVGESAPATYLLCNGAAVNTYTYRVLHAVISNNFGGTAYQAGVTDQPGAVTTFNLPDFRTSTRIPLGVDSSVTTPTNISSPGRSGGSFNHTHTSVAHSHTFSHSHTLGNHTHSANHYHTMSNHTHTTNHQHIQAGVHSHIIYAHGHDTGGVSYSISSNSGHTHSFTMRYGDAGTDRPRPADANNGSLLFYTSYNTQTLGLNATVGNTIYGWEMSNNDYITYTGAPQLTTGETNNTTNSISTNNTSTSTFNTSSISTNSSGTSSSNTDSGGGDIVSSSNNPPYLTINFLIKCLGS